MTGKNNQSKIVYFKNESANGVVMDFFFLLRPCDDF